MVLSSICRGKFLLSSTTSRGRATSLGPARGARNWAPVVRKDAGGWPSPHCCTPPTINTAHNTALQGWGRNGPWNQINGGTTNSAVWLSWQVPPPIETAHLPVRMARVTLQAVTNIYGNVCLGAGRPSWPPSGYL